MVIGVSSSIVVQTLELGFIGQLGTSHVAAMTFTFPVVMILTSIALGIGIGTSSVIARSVGSGDVGDARQLGTHGMMLVAGVLTVLSIIAMLTIDPLFTALGASPEVLELIRTYLVIYYPGTVLFTITMVAGNVMRAHGQAAVPGYVMAVGAGFNLLIDPFLIFGWWGLPRMELAGAATAMLITRVATSLVLLYFVTRQDLIKTTAIRKAFLASSRRIMAIGLPAMATQLIGPVSVAIITRLLANHGETVVAGYGVATRIEAVAVMLLFALSGSIGPFVGQNYGAGLMDRVQAGLHVSYKFCLAWGLTVALLLLAFGQPLAALIDDAESVYLVAGFYLAVVPWSYGMWGVLMMSSASFNALGKPIPSTIMSFTRMFVVHVPLALLLDSQFGYRGIFAATLTSNLIMGMVGYWWFRKGVFDSVSTKAR